MDEQQKAGESNEPKGNLVERLIARMRKNPDIAIGLAVAVATLVVGILVFRRGGGNGTATGAGATPVNGGTSATTAGSADPQALGTTQGAALDPTALYEEQASFLQALQSTLSGYATSAPTEPPMSGGTTGASPTPAPAAPAPPVVSTAPTPTSGQPPANGTPTGPVMYPGGSGPGGPPIHLAQPDPATIYAQNSAAGLSIPASLSPSIGGTSVPVVMQSGGAYVNSQGQTVSGTTGGMLPGLPQGAGQSGTVYYGPGNPANSPQFNQPAPAPASGMQPIVQRTVQPVPVHQLPVGHGGLA